MVLPPSLLKLKLSLQCKIRVSVPLDELLNSNRLREMLPLFQNYMPCAGPLFDANKHKTIFFNNPYSKPRDSYSLRFWTQEQAIYYTRMLFNQDKLFKHQYLDFPSMYATGCFQNITPTTNDFHVHRLFAANHSFNPELIKQFYASLYVSAHRKKPKVWKFDYMIQG